uniref:Transmembrane protein n=1 Tax=Strongyloides stercoralis TaxID=6248 RepID=A0AAF5I173_STRER
MTAPTERFHVLAQLEHLHSKFVGTGHADSTRWEWLTNQHRDTLSSIIGMLSFLPLIHYYLGHQDNLSYVAVAQNKSKARVKFELLKKMIQPCGPPPEKSPLDDL